MNDRANLPDAATSDPLRMGWMSGFPPDPERRIRYEDGSFLRFPQLRWSFSHMRELVPTVEVKRGRGAPAVLPVDLRSDLDAIPIRLANGQTMTWLESLAANYTDGIVVLHQGRLVYERYFGAGSPDQPHIAFSVTKSFVGTLAAMLAEEGALEPDAPVVTYVPELAGSAYADACVRQVMDMTIGVDCSEDYTDPNAGIYKMMRASGAIPGTSDENSLGSLYAYLPTAPKLGPHGEAFAYRTINTEVLGWILRRASKQSLAMLLSERIWQKLGAEQDAYLWIDRAGTELAGGGLCAVLRDLTRFGEMIRLKGAFNGQQIVPAAVVADIQKGADPVHFERARMYSESFPKGSYRNMWWITHNEHGAFSARGVHGQVIWIDPKAEMVIARFGSHHLAANIYIDPTSLPAYQAMGEYLMR
ncbi:MAG: serine hydrolase [Burkholderiaceae bacterium]|jgi:CubicO group peptidase (beta-lactamase class C family)